MHLTVSVDGSRQRLQMLTFHERCKLDVLVECCVYPDVYPDCIGLSPESDFVRQSFEWYNIY